MKTALRLLLASIVTTLLTVGVLVALSDPSDAIDRRDCVSKVEYRQTRNYPYFETRQQIEAHWEVAPVPSPMVDDYVDLPGDWYWYERCAYSTTKALYGFRVGADGYARDFMKAKLVGAQPHGNP